MQLPPDQPLTLSAFAFDANITASEIRFVGAAGTILSAGASGGGSGGRRALSGLAADTTIFTISPGAPPVFLEGLTISGHIAVHGGTLDIANCTFDGTGLSGARALTVSGGAVTLRSSDLNDFDAGGMRVTDGEVRITGGVLTRNGRAPASTFGGIEMVSPGGSLWLVGTTIEHNGRLSNSCDGGVCVRGGGLSVLGTSATVAMSGSTVVRRNRAYEGDQIYVDTAFASLTDVRYTLPTPLGHYVIITDRSDNTAVGMPIIDSTFPYECSPGNYGGLFNTSMQTTPRCSGPCPRGHYCPSATITPIMCAAGKYCVEGSDAEVNCPAGTFSVVAGLGAVDGCMMCSAGTACVAGSAVEVPCALGTHAPNNGSTSCDLCPAGSYQDETGQVDCKICTAGHFCPEGSTQLQPCPSGKYADTVGLRNASQCSMCPLGSFCIEGSPSPTQCFKGTIGAFEGLTGPFLCQACIAPATSEPGSTGCDRCDNGNFLDPDGALVNRSANRLAECQLCLSGATCDEGATLTSVNLTDGYWRLAPEARSISKCHVNDDGISPCKGGINASADGQGYCVAGHEGPLCELCTDPGFYFKRTDGRCIECPQVQSVVGYAGLAGGLFAVGLAMLAFVLHRPPRALRDMSTIIRRIMLKSRSYALLPKAKILIALYQMIVAIPGVYDVSLPDEYHRWMQTITWISFDWDEFVVPGACLPGGFSVRVMLRGIAPMTLMLAVIPFMVLKTVVLHVVKCKPGFPPVYRALLNSLPIVLFIAFCFCATVSAGLFESWSCAVYEVGTPAGDPPVTRSFLRADPSVECIDTDETFLDIRSKSWAFIVLWPIGVPLFFLLVLIPSRRSILQKRSTRLVRATSILHREYEPEFFFWEPIFLLQRLIIVGFIQFIPPSLSLIRLQLGQIVTLLYTIVLMFLQPYKRRDMDVLAVTAQISLLAFFYGAINIKLHALLNDADPGHLHLALKVTGFESATSLAVIIFAFNLLSIALFFLMTMYQMRVQRDTSSIRLKENSQVPELTLGSGKKFHLFLSHIWSSGQDQVATIKRQLQLLLPGIRVFLDVDDLQEIGKLEEYIEQSQCILIFLSRNYFFSTNCLRELDHALKMNKPLVLVHENDLSHGGAALETLMADCHSKGAERMALFQRQPLILPWERAHDFQLVTLQGIASALLHAGNLVRAIDKGRASSAKSTTRTRGAEMTTSIIDKPPAVYIPGEIRRQKLIFDKRIKIYASPNNPGAHNMADEISDKYTSDLLYVYYRPTPELAAATRRAVAREAGRSADSDGPAPAEAASAPFGEAASMLGVGRGDSFGGLTHFLLYLNSETYLHEKGQVLAQEVRLMMEARIPIVMVHESDPDKGGCLFSHFFQTTPEDLIAHGLYKKIAISCQPAALRDVSLALIAKGFGAVPKRSAVGQALHRTQTRALGLAKARHKTGPSGAPSTEDPPSDGMHRELTRRITARVVGGGTVGGDGVGISTAGTVASAAQRLSLDRSANQKQMLTTLQEDESTTGRSASDWFVDLKPEEALAPSPSTEMRFTDLPASQRAPPDAKTQPEPDLDSPDGPSREDSWTAPAAQLFERMSSAMSPKHVPSPGAIRSSSGGLTDDFGMNSSMTMHATEEEEAGVEAEGAAQAKEKEKGSLDA